MKRVALSSLVIGIFVLTAAGCSGDGTTRRLSQRPSDIRYINLPGRTDDLPFSHAVLVGDTLYLGGILEIDPDTGDIASNVQQEIRIVLDTMKQRLEMAGMTMNDLVSVEVVCPDLSLYDEFNAIYRTYFKDHFPTRAFIGSGQLRRGAHLEIMGIAAVKR